jgi:squalene cyclase
LSTYWRYEDNEAREVKAAQEEDGVRRREEKECEVTPGKGVIGTLIFLRIPPSPHDIATVLAGPK